MRGHQSFEPSRWRIAALASILALVAAGCGGDDDESEGAPASDGTAAATTTAPSADDGDAAAADDTEDMAEPPAEDDHGETSGEASEPADEPEGTGDEPDTDEPEETEPDVPEEPIQLTDSWRGVTAETITIGASLLDFQLLKDLGLSRAGWGDQRAVFNAFVDDLNANGGINGRMLEVVYDSYSPISAEDATRSCTELTQDNEVFAVLLGFVGPLAGTADPCIPGTYETVLVGGVQTGAELASADELSPSGKRAPWFHLDASVEDQTANLLNLLVETGRADGARVFVISHQSAMATEEPVLEAVRSRGIEVVGNALLDANDNDQAAQDAIMQVISERIRADGANTVLINGNPSAALRGLIQSGLLSDLTVWSNDESGLNNLGASVDRPSVRGVLTSGGPTEAELWADPLMQECVEMVRAAVPDADLRSPLELADGDENWFNPIRRYCSHLSLFVQIATRAGGDLTPETFEQAAFTMTDFALPGVPANSLSPTKLGALDLFRLGAYDPDEGDGQATPVTDLIDVYP